MTSCLSSPSESEEAMSDEYYSVTIMSTFAHGRQTGAPDLPFVLDLSGPPVTNHAEGEVERVGR